MPATPRSRARSARCRPRCTWCRPSADVARLRGRRSGQARLHHPDDAVGRRHPRHHRRAEGALPRHRRAGRARHLLCDAEPPAGGARPGRRGRHDPGGRLAQQLQLQPAARDRRGAGQAVLPDRRRRRAAAGVVRRRAFRSASPPAPRRRRRWCRACSTGCASSARSTSPPWPAWRRTCASASPSELADA